MAKSTPKPRNGEPALSADAKARLDKLNKLGERAEMLEARARVIEAKIRLHNAQKMLRKLD